MIELINRNNRSQHLYINQSTEKNKLISKGPIMLTGLITLHTVATDPYHYILVMKA